MGVKLVKVVDVDVTPKLSAKDKRQKAIDLLLSGSKLSDGAIALQCGLHRNSVLTLRKKMRQGGQELALSDGRENNGSEAKYNKFWDKILELKAVDEQAGGREIWTKLVDEHGYAPEEIPAVSSIERFFSQRQMVAPKMTAKTDKRPYYMEDYYKPMVRVGMDCQTVAPYGQNFECAVISCIDFYTRAVYSEAFPWNHTNAFHYGVSPAAYCSVLLKFVCAFGVPKVIVLDNGAGQITQNGWLSEVAKTALSLGIRVEWEPYGRPWRNGAVENWHRHSQRWWEDARHKVKTMEEARIAWRKRALTYTKIWPQRKFQNKAAASVLPVFNPWPVEGEGAELVTLPACERYAHEWEGMISFQREVETGGYVKLHGNTHMWVSKALVGGYVRIDMHIRARGQSGSGTVYDGKGIVVGNFRHQFEAHREPGIDLVYDYNAQGYADSQDVREKYYNQQAYNRLIERAQKNLRAESDYACTGSVPIMRSRKRKGSRATSQTTPKPS